MYIIFASHRFEFGLVKVESGNPVLGPLDLLTWQERQNKIRYVDHNNYLLCHKI